jgi:replicative DNA helicase
MEVDRILPHDERLERDVLGAVLLESDAINEINFLTATDFHSGKHQIIFEAVTTLNEAGSPIDIITVTEELRRVGKYETVGGAYFVSSLTNEVL